LVSKDIIVTIRNSRNIVPLNELLEDCKKEEVLVDFLGGSIYESFYYLFGRLFDFCERQLRHIEEKIVKIEKEIFKNSKKSVLKDLVSVKRDLLDFNRIFLQLTLKFNSFCFFVKNL
jgi:Mg2+ and Co2+ transporter CorA